MRASAAVLALLVAASAPLAAQRTIVAFGDSITLGNRPFDEEGKGGYPARLQRILRSEEVDAEVLNAGVSGETTAQGLSRILAVTDPGDTVLIMEGTNDVDLIELGQLSIESVRANLAAMGSRARSRDVEVIFSTIIPRGPSARRDRDGATTHALNLAIREIAFQGQYGEVESYQRLLDTPRVWGELYYPGPEDPVGHPNAAGFEVLAQTFADVLLGRDTMHPVIGEVHPNPFLVEEVSPGDVFDLVLYDFGAGLDRPSLTLALNDVPVETQGAGSERRRLLSHEATNDTIPCYARLAVNGLDQADPPNRIDEVVAEYARRNASVRGTDVNRDCRVDGRDILRVAELFGLERQAFAYDPVVDVDNDGAIDGSDLARVAADFGKSSL